MIALARAAVPSTSHSSPLNRSAVTNASRGRARPSMDIISSGSARADLICCTNRAALRRSTSRASRVGQLPLSGASCVNLVSIFSEILVPVIDHRRTAPGRERSRRLPPTRRVSAVSGRRFWWTSFQSRVNHSARPSAPSAAPKAGRYSGGRPATAGALRALSMS